MDYQSNSNKSKEDKPKKETSDKVVNKVVGADVKKKGGFRRFASAFIAEDAADLKKHFINDILIPKAKSTVLELVSAVLYSEDERLTRKTGGLGRIAYNGFFSGSAKQSPARAAVSNGYEVLDIVLATRGDAEIVLTNMDALIEAYKYASVEDLYSLVGFQGEPIDSNWGWGDLRSADVVPVRDGYRLRLPRAVPIK